jgi:hypothetical protein
MHQINGIIHFCGVIMLAYDILFICTLKEQKNKYDLIDKVSKKKSTHKSLLKDFLLNLST